MGEQSILSLLAETLRRQQRERWQAGTQIPAETYLQQHPELQNAPDYAVELIYQEVVLRQQQGEEPLLEEYLRRFPQFAGQLKPLFEVHRALEADVPFDGETTQTPTAGVPPQATAPVLAELPAIPGYEIIDELGRGGMGVVYRAWQTNLKRTVALKVVLAGSHAGPHELARFRTEAEAIARLRHPNIVQIYDVGRHGTHPYMVLEYVEGGSLARKLAGTPLPARQAAQLVETLAQAVHSAHERGIIHRDLTPGNVLLTADGAPKITDFGLAKLLVGGGEAHTESGAILGTASYMAPEQAAGKIKEIGPATDVYALGTLLYEMLTGRPPFRAETTLETLRQVQAVEPVSPSRLQPRLPRDLATICLKCLEKGPGKRYLSALALAEDLRRFLAGEPIQARPVGNPEKLWRWCRRKPAVAGLSAFVVLLLVGITLVSALSALSLGRERIETKKQLVNAYLSQAQALRRSGRAGHRFSSLQILGETAKLVRSLKLDDEYIPQVRNEAIACLALFDLSLEKEWDGWSPSESVVIDFDGTLAHYARLDRKGAVSIRRVEDDAEILRLPEHGSAISFYNLALYGLWWSRDGKFLAVESEPDRRLKVWRLTDQKCVVETKAAILTKMGAADFSPDSRELVVGHPDGTLSLYDLASGQRLRQLKPGLTAIQHLAFHPKKRQVAVACNPDVRICDLESGQVVATLPLALGAFWVAWNPEGTTVAASGGDSNIYLWDEATRKQTQVLRGHKNGGIAFNFNHTGDLLASSGWEGVLRLWDPRTGQQLFSTPAAISIPRFSPDGRLAAAIEGTKLRLFKVTVSRGCRTLVRAPVLGGEHYRRTAFSPDGRLLAAAMWDGVGLWDAASGTALDSLPLGDTFGVLFEPSGALLTSSRAGLLRWPVDPAATEVVRIGPPQKLPVTVTIANIACSQDGSVIAITQGDGGLVLHNDRPDRPVRLRPHYDVRTIAVSPDGRLVATGSHSGVNVKVWEAETGNFVIELPTGPLSFPLFSPDGRWLATRGQGGCRLWAVGSWREGPALDANTLPAFSPDSKLLAVGTSQGLIRLVDPDTGREYARLEESDQEQIEFLTFSPDGTQLVAVGGGGQWCHVWDLRALGQSLAELGLPWDLPSSLPPGPENSPQPLRLTIQLDAPQYEQRGQIHSRAHQYTEAIADFLKALELDPNRAEACNTLAWIYVTAPTQFRDAEQALPLALKATQLAPTEASYQNTLGVVYYRLGKCEQAIAALERSLQKTKHPAHDLFFLAMSYQQKGDSAKAQDHYERALRWWQGQGNSLPQGHIDELTAFRAEAEALLKIVSKPSS